MTAVEAVVVDGLCTLSTTSVRCNVICAGFFVFPIYDSAATADDAFLYRFRCLSCLLFGFSHSGPTLPILPPTATHPSPLPLLTSHLTLPHSVAHSKILAHGTRRLTPIPSPSIWLAPRCGTRTRRASRVMCAPGPKASPTSSSPAFVLNSCNTKAPPGTILTNRRPALHLAAARGFLVVARSTLRPHRQLRHRREKNPSRLRQLSMSKLVPNAPPCHSCSRSASTCRPNLASTYSSSSCSDQVCPFW